LGLIAAERLALVDAGGEATGARSNVGGTRPARRGPGKRARGKAGGCAGRPDTAKAAGAERAPDSKSRWRGITRTCGIVPHLPGKADGSPREPPPSRGREMGKG